jgi:hypothetical protein
MPVEDLKIWDLTRIYDSDRILRAEAHNVGTPEVYSGKGP